MKCYLDISNFLEEISTLSNSVVFLYFFALMLRKAFLSLLAILWNSAFKWEYLSFSPLLFTSLCFTAICRPPQTTILPFCVSFPWGWSWSFLLCHEPPYIVHQGLFRFQQRVGFYSAKVNWTYHSPLKLCAFQKVSKHTEHWHNIACTKNVRISGGEIWLQESILNPPIL